MEARAAPCLVCGDPDPAPEMTCGRGGYEHGPRDHRVGVKAGCPSCGRLKAACARRPCAAMCAGPGFLARILRLRVRHSAGSGTPLWQGWRFAALLLYLYGSVGWLAWDPSTAPEGDAAPPQPDGRDAGQEPEPAAAMTPRPPQDEIPVRRLVPPARRPCAGSGRPWTGCDPVTGSTGGPQICRRADSMPRTSSRISAGRGSASPGCTT